jgi:hypothetical protein
LIKLTYRDSAVGDFSVQPTHWQGNCSPAPFIEGALFTAAVAAAAVAVTEAEGAGFAWIGAASATGAGNVGCVVEGVWFSVMMPRNSIWSWRKA